VTRTYEATIAHFFCGSGGGGLGSSRARAEVVGHAARFRVLGGIDVDPLACQDFEHLVAAVWRWLLTVTPDALRALPDVPHGASLDDSEFVGLADVERAFIGFHLGAGEVRPRHQVCGTGWRVGPDMWTPIEVCRADGAGTP
jgi:hypothetical protein